VKLSRQVALILLTCGFIAVAVAVIWPGKPEPMYNGRSLSKWEGIYKICLDSDAPGERENAMAREAVKAAHEMRTNIIPIALKDIQCETPAWPRQFAEKIEESDFLSRWCPNSIWMLLNEDRGRDGMIYFRMLGPDGSPAVPDLTRVMNQTKSVQVRVQAMFALGHIGSEGLKPLTAALTNPRFPDHPRAVYAIGIALDNGADASLVVPLLINTITNSDDTIFEAAVRVLSPRRLEPQSVVPALIDCLGSTNSVRRNEAIKDLREYGDKAHSAVPYLIKALGDPDESVRYFATNALEKTAPEVLGTNMPPAP
jgi:hypothetical protein